MSDETANETVVLENLEKVEHSSDNPERKHYHHLREVVCKPGTESITMEPIALGNGKTYDKREKYVRTEHKDEMGRAIFRMETA